MWETILLATFINFSQRSLEGDVNMTFQQLALVLISLAIGGCCLKCEYTFMSGGSSTLLGGPCEEVAKESDVAAVYIKAINITDGWVYFELAR